MQEIKPQQHFMTIDKTHDSGGEEWLCPTCGRRMLIQWEPSFNWMVLEVGNEHAFHNGTKGGIIIQNITKSDQEEAESSEADRSEMDDPKLGPWKDWLDKFDFDNL